MSELYHLISSCNPNHQTLILTALEGEAKGEIRDRRRTAYREKTAF